MSTASLPDIDSALERFQDADSARMQLLRQVVQQYKDLEARLASLQDDYDSEKEARLGWQRRCRTAEEQASHAQSRNNSSPFALALIDGDGAIFREELLKAKGDGGNSAAHALASAIKAHLRQYGEPAVRYDVVVQIFANFEGLAKCLASVGYLSRPEDLYLFVREFNLSFPHFTFLDIGPGKERADHKVRETFRLYVDNVHCKHIFFGPCSDNGYLPMLESYRSDDSVTSRLTLFQSTPAQPRYTQLGFRIIEFLDVFRSEELPLRTYTAPTAISGPAAMTARLPVGGPPSPLAHTELVSTQPNSPSGGTLQTASSAPPGRPIPHTVSYATAGNPAPTDWIDVSSKPAPARKYFLLNADSQRVDEQIRIDATARARLQDRINRMGTVCNNYHLLGTCQAGTMCKHNHEPRLDKDAQKALRLKARTSLCPRGSGCTNVDCPLGHHCPMFPACTMPWCKFEAKDLHGIDTVPHLKQFDDGEVILLTRTRA